MKKLLPILCCIGLCGCLGTTLTQAIPQPEQQPIVTAKQQQIQAAPKAVDLSQQEPNEFTKGSIGWPAVLIISGFMIVAPAAIVKMKGI